MNTPIREQIERKIQEAKKKNQVASWDQYYMSMVYLVATRSKDESTNVGAVIVDEKNILVATGYNSFPRGINDYVPERQERPEKYYWFEHAERNAIFCSTRENLNGCKMYTPGLPCMDCARAIVQVGIKEVIIHKAWDEVGWSEKWEENHKRTRELFKEAGIKTTYYTGPILQITSKKRGVNVF